jgi:hypothetical protein
MIKYSLICDSEHEFDGWFPNSKSFDAQKKKGQLTCPVCDSGNVNKALMAPGVQTSKKKKKEKKMESYRKSIVSDEMMLASQAKTVMRRIKKHIEKEFENVGNKFYDEAIKASEGQRDDKFYGTPTNEQVTDLLDDGIDLFHVPDIKDN